MKLTFWRHLFKCFLLCACTCVVRAQSSSHSVKVEPPFWWTKMANHDLQLMVYGKEVSQYKVSLDYPGVLLEQTILLESPNYLFLNLRIEEDAIPGTLSFAFTKEDSQFTMPYELRERGTQRKTSQGVDGSDVIYLITPDRFANGDTSNDSTEDTLEKVDRANINGRHGGDLKGITEHFDYLKDLGVTTLWLNPILENNQEKFSYHGYGISDFYKVDPRFGSNTEYKDLVKKCHAHGMKVIMDQVFNHCGVGHWWMEDLPAKNWLNQWDKFTRSNFTTITASDPYASPSDFKLLTKGWFDSNLPDMNLDNQFVETYLIQNSIWWIEYAGIDGIRMDTYPYPEKAAMANWMQRLTAEYPDYFMVAETWTQRASYLSYWNSDGENTDGYMPFVNSISDYPLYFAMLRAFGANGDVYELFETLAEDFIYGTPENNKVFNGNHDVDRLMALLGNNVDKLKLSMAFVLTTRGIPQLYYGDEILMKNRRPDGAVREDFPGGWKGDERDAFTKTGRTPQENGAHNYIRNILRWRKGADAIHKGKLTHYQPLDNVYVYFRYTDKNRVMVLLNNSDKDYQNFGLSRFSESLVGFSSGTDVITGDKITNLQSVKLPKNTAVIIDLEP